MGVVVKAWMVVVILVCVCAGTVHAQDASPVAYILAPTKNSINIQGLTPSGTLEPVSDLPGFRIGDWGEAEWTIPTASDLKVSPNGRFVAFPAFRDESDIAVFIYNFDQNHLEQVITSNLVDIVWSPDSDAILMRQLLSDFSLPFPDPAPPTYVYELTTRQLVQVTDGPSNLERDTIWIGNDTFVYSGSGIPCAPPCEARNDLYLGSRFRIDTAILTNLGEQIPVDYFHNICEPIWSYTEERIYFAVDCKYVGLHAEKLYSVDLSGHLQPELDPTFLYLDAHQFHIQAVLLAPEGEIFVVVFSEEIYQYDYDHFWRVFELDSQDNPQVIYEARNPSEGSYLQTASLSPTAQYIALVGSILQGDENDGGMAIIDTITGDVVLSHPVESMDIACTMTWLDDHTLVYSQVEGGTCNRHRDSVGVYSLDVLKGTITPLATGDEFPVWLLPIPKR